MSFIKFDKNQLVNLEYSLSKEMLRSNRAGSFSCHTIIGCNTRKYHGLLISPQPLLGNTPHVLLSKVEETIIQREAEFNIGINRYPNTYSPKGHKYVRDFSADVIPKITYRVGGVVLTKETLFITNEEKVIIKYTLVEAQSPTLLRIKPFLAFRSIHHLSKKNIYLDTKYDPVPNGIKTRMYQGYSPLYMQFSKKKIEYIHSPDWYNDLEYFHEKERGYEYREDLYVPGFFEVSVKKGESVLFAAGTHETNPLVISKNFTKESKLRTPRNSYGNCLKNSAEQFFYSHDQGTDIIAGYPWYDRIGRFTFISLPGLSLAKTNLTACRDVMDTMISQMSGPFFPETGRGENTTYRSADTSLWFIWALQQCHYNGVNKKEIQKNYFTVVKNIIESYAAGNDLLTMHDNGLIFINPWNSDVTWMNAAIDGRPVTPRHGYTVEVNALWYNALIFAVEIAKQVKDHDFANRWKEIAEKTAHNFIDVFWNQEKEYLADFMIDGFQNMSVRPNMILAASMPNTPLSDSNIMSIIDISIKQLLTPKGIRTLTPEDPNYRGKYSGNEKQRDLALHQGTVYPWILGHFSQAYLKIYKDSGLEYIKKIYENFQEDMTEDGIGNISEFFEGDPPHQSKGAISFAPSVAELLRIRRMIKDMEKKLHV